MQANFKHLLGYRASYSTSFAQNAAIVIGYHFESSSFTATATPKSALDFSRCASAWDANMLWMKAGSPKQSCSPQEQFWRSKSPHQRPAGWRDDPI